MNSDKADSIDVFVGVDGGKAAHHAVALSKAGVVLFDRALPQDEAALVELITTLKTHGRVLFVVDQPATIGALPLAVARAHGVEVGYLPGLAVRRIADLHSGEAKTDARHAAIIAQAARSMPHALRALRRDDELTGELAMLAGCDEDLAGQINQVSNRIRGLLTRVHPALERVLGPRLDHPAVLDLLERYPSPAAIRALGKNSLTTRLRRLAPRIGDQLADAIVTALDEQTVVIAGTDAAAKVLPRLGEQLIVLRRQRDEIAGQVEELIESHPLFEVLNSMPGMGFRTIARVLVETTGRDFPSASHLARLRRPGPRDPTLRNINPGRTSVTTREPRTQTSPLPFRLLRAPRPDLACILRPQTNGTKESSIRPPRSRSATLRRPLRHDARQHHVQPRPPDCRLTTT